jgi:hypothetical protein
MNLGNKSLAKRIGKLTLPGMLLVAGLVLVVIALVVEERGKGPNVIAAKNWVLIIVAIAGLYAVLAQMGRAGPRASMRIGVSIALFVALLYVSIQDLQSRNYTFLGLTAITVQTLLLLVLIAPMFARMAKIGVADVTPGSVLTKLR